jgi:hypothetical protein
MPFGCNARCVTAQPMAPPKHWHGCPVIPARVGVNPDGVRALAATDADLDAVFDGHTLLHHAVWMGDVVDAEPGSTPLGWAEQGHSRGDRRDLVG